MNVGGSGYPKCVRECVYVYVGFVLKDCVMEIASLRTYCASLKYKIGGKGKSKERKNDLGVYDD